jgi:hypothetical protein
MESLPVAYSIFWASTNRLIATWFALMAKASDTVEMDSRSISVHESISGLHSSGSGAVVAKDRRAVALEELRVSTLSICGSLL